MNLMLWEDSNFKPLQSPLIPLHASKDLISDGSHVLYLPLNSLNPWIGIRTLASNSSTYLVVSNEGLVFGCSFLKENQLCPYTENSFALIQIPNLMNIIQVSLSSSHAAAITESGQLFTWGEGSSGQLGHLTTSFYSFPIQVKSCQYLKVTQVSCGQNFTSILTDGCYVHIYGKIGLTHESIQKTLCKKSLLAFSHTQLNNEKVVMIQTGSNFISCLNETGEVFILDGCSDLVKLPAKSDWIFESIIASEVQVCGKLKDGIVIWESQGIDNKVECELSLWAGKMWKCESSIMVFSWGKSILLGLDEGDVLEFGYIVKPYKRSEIGNVLMKRMVRKNTDGFVKDERTPAIMRSNSGELFDEEDYFKEKFVKTLSNSIYDKIILMLYEGFSAIKETSLIKHWQKTSLKELSLLNLIRKNYKKRSNHMKFVSFYKIKLLTLSYFPLKSSDFINKLQTLEIVLKKIIKRNILSSFKSMVSIFKLDSALDLILKYFLKSSFETIKYLAQVQKTFSKLELLKSKHNKKKNFSLFVKNTLNKSTNLIFTKDQHNSNFFLLNNYKNSQENLIELSLNHFFSIITSIKRKILSKTFNLLKNSLAIKTNLHLLEILMKKVIIRKCRTYFNSLLCQSRLSFRPIKNLVKKRVKNYLNQIILYSAHESNCYLLKLLYSTQCIFANHAYRDKLFAFRALNMYASQSADYSKISALSLSRSLSNRTLDSITETPRKQKTNSPEPITRITKPLKSESLSIAFKSPPKNYKTISDYLLCQSPSISKAKSPKPTRPPWRPPSHFTSPPVSPNRLIAHRRRKQYTDFLKVKPSPRTLKCKNAKLISSSKQCYSQSNSPAHEKMISINLGLMNINRVLKRYTTKSKSHMFRTLKSYSRNKYIPAPGPNDDKTILSIIRTSWKAGVIMLASEKTRDLMSRIIYREFISILKTFNKSITLNP